MSGWLFCRKMQRNGESRWTLEFYSCQMPVYMQYLQVINTASYYHFITIHTVDVVQKFWSTVLNTNVTTYQSHGSRLHSQHNGWPVLLFLVVKLPVCFINRKQREVVALAFYKFWETSIIDLLIVARSHSLREICHIWGFHRLGMFTCRRQKTYSTYFWIFRHCSLVSEHHLVQTQRYPHYHTWN